MANDAPVVVPFVAESGELGLTVRIGAVTTRVAVLPIAMIFPMDELTPIRPDAYAAVVAFIESDFDRYLALEVELAEKRHQSGLLATSQFQRRPTTRVLTTTAADGAYFFEVATASGGTSVALTKDGGLEASLLPGFLYDERGATLEDDASAIGAVIDYVVSGAAPVPAEVRERVVLFWTPIADGTRAQ